MSTAWSQASRIRVQANRFLEPFGLDLSAIDKHTRPQDDFYQYVGGAWIARTRIPADRDQVDEMQDRTDARIRGLLEASAAAQHGPAVTPAQKSGTMYAAFMDADRIEGLGFSPIDPELATVRAAPDRAALARIMGQSFAGFGGSIFAASFTLDLGHRGGRRTGLALTDDVHVPIHAARWNVSIERATTGSFMAEPPLSWKSIKLLAFHADAQFTSQSPRLGFQQSP